MDIVPQAKGKVDLVSSKSYKKLKVMGIFVWYEFPKLKVKKRMS
jgi:hypothetical protein